MGFAVRVGQPKTTILKDRIEHVGKDFIALDLTVVAFRDDEANCFVGLVPSIQVTSYADSLAELDDVMQDAIDICLKSWLMENVLEQELQKLGWAKHIAKPKKPAHKKTTSQPYSMERIPEFNTVGPMREARQYKESFRYKLEKLA